MTKKKKKTLSKYQQDIGTCLIVAVQVSSSVAEFYSGPHYGVGHRRAVRELLHGYRAVETVVIGLDQTGVAVRLGLLEVRQHVVVSPAGDAGVTPTVVH